MIYVNSQGPQITIHLARKVQIVLMLAKKATVLAKHLDFAEVFLRE